MRKRLEDRSIQDQGFPQDFSLRLLEHRALTWVVRLKSKFQSFLPASRKKVDLRLAIMLRGRVMVRLSDECRADSEPGEIGGEIHALCDVLVAAGAA